MDKSQHYIRPLEEIKLKPFPHKGGIDVWDGTPISNQSDNNILAVIGFEAYGENIMTCRFIRDMAGLFDKIYYIVPRELKSVFAASKIADEIFHFQDNIPPVTHYANLPDILPKINLQLSSDAYLQPSFDRCAKWQENINHILKTAGHENFFKVGLVWAGEPQRMGDATRSLTFEIFKNFLQIKNVHFFSFQVGDKALTEKDTANCGDIITDLAPKLHDFDESAAALMQMHLLISTDTSVPHLAGGLGQPVWLLMPHDLIDWRWRMDKISSDVLHYKTMWYNKMHILKQKTQNNWYDNILLAAQNLHKFAQDHAKHYNIKN